MGNVSEKDEASPSGTKSEEYMECVHFSGAYVSEHAPGPFPDSMVQFPPPHSPGAYQSPLMLNPQVSMVPSQRPDELMNGQSIDSIQDAKESMPSGNGIPAMITWSYDGKQVAVEGSWDNWKTREFLQRSGKDFSVMKVLQSGVYHYRFVVDGQWRCAPELPRESDDMGNIFHILNLQDCDPEATNNVCSSDSPPSPVSSYDNSPFSPKDFNQKVPKLSQRLQKASPDCPSSSNYSPESLEKPLAAVLNHLHVQKGLIGQSVLALSSTQRFQAKYVTVVLYKSMKKVKS